MSVARVSTDLTARGTRLYDEHGDLLPHVVALRRVGRDLFVTTRYRDVDVDGVHGDFEVSLRGRHNG